MTEKSSPSLEFSEKYSAEHAREYFRKHQAGFWRRLSNRREIAIARKALNMAGNPASVLDLPSGTGRFWELLYSAADDWDLKAALPFRLTSDGQQYAAELELTFRF